MKFIIKEEYQLSTAQFVEVTYVPALKEWRLLITGQYEFDPPEIYRGDKKYITDMYTKIIKNDVLEA